jgi:hypothetical protein
MTNIDSVQFHQTGLEHVLIDRTIITYLQVRENGRLVMLNQFASDFLVSQTFLVSILMKVRCSILPLMYKKPIKRNKINDTDISC